MIDHCQTILSEIEIDCVSYEEIIEKDLLINVRSTFLLYVIGKIDDHLFASMPSALPRNASYQFI